MNRSKRIALLLCVLVLISAATFAMTRYESHKENIRVGGQVILEIPTEDVQTLSWSYEDESLSFHRDTDGVWRWDEDDAFPVDEDHVNDLLSWFSSLSAAFVIEDVEDYSQYGLTQPECTISFATEGDQYTVSLGDFSQMDSQRYLSLDDGNAYLIAEDPMEDFQLTIQDMIQNDEAPEIADVIDMTFTGAENYTLRYEEQSGKSYLADDVYFADDKPLDTQRVESYLDSLEGLNLTDYATYNATQEALASFGMDDPELTVTVNYRSQDEEEAFTLHISRDPEAVKEAEAASEAEAEEEDIPCYLRFGDSPIVYNISQELYDTLTKVSYNDLRHQELFWGDFDDITSMDVTMDDRSYTLTTVKGTEEEEAASQEDSDKILWYYQGEEIETDDLGSALLNLTVEDFTDDQPTDKEEISLTLHLNNEDFPTVKLQLYRQDGSNCLAVVDGTPTALIKRVYMVDLMEAVNAIVLNAQ